MFILFLQQRIHPLLYVTFACILGIYCCSISPAYLTYGALFILGSAFFIAYTHSVTYKLPVMLPCLLFAYGLGAWRLAHYYDHYSNALLPLQGQSCHVRGHIIDSHPVDHPRFKHCFTLALQKFCYSSTTQWTSCTPTIQLYVRHNIGLAIDDLIEISSLVFKKEKTTTNFTHYRLKEGISATLFVDTFYCTIIDRPQWSLKRWIFNKRRALLLSFKKKLSPTTFNLFSSIFLGNKEASKQEMGHLKEHFNTWGITHYLARSGLHMVIFVISWQVLLGFIPLPFMIKEVLLLMLGLIYYVLSWPTVSFNRAFLLFLVCKLCLLARLQTDFLYLLSGICCAILLYNPLQLFFLDFQLSFGLTFALAYFGQLNMHLRHARHKTVASSQPNPLKSV